MKDKASKVPQSLNFLGQFVKCNLSKIIYCMIGCICELYKDGFGNDMIANRRLTENFFVIYDFYTDILCLFLYVIFIAV